MVVTITSIELKSPFKFFVLSYNAMKILRQLKTTNCISQKARGIWTMHYTMTLWKSMEDAKSFSKSGAHLEAMKLSAQLAKEIRILSYESNSLPDWKEAKKKLYSEGKSYKF